MNVPLAEIQKQMVAHKFSEEIRPKLLDIKTYQYTREEVQKLEALCAARKREHAQLHGTSVVQMWKNNLGEI